MGWVVEFKESVGAGMGEGRELGCAETCGLDEDGAGWEGWKVDFCSWDGGGLLRPFEMAVGSGLSCGVARVFSERSIGLETSSKLEVSSSSAVSVSSLSANLLARLAMEVVCSFMDGGGPRRFMGGESDIVGSGSGAFFVGEGIFAAGAFVAGW